MIIISRKIGDKEVSFIYNSKVDGPLEVYKRNPNFTIKEVAYGDSTNKFHKENKYKMLLPVNPPIIRTDDPKITGRYDTVDFGTTTIQVELTEEDILKRLYEIFDQGSSKKFSSLKCTVDISTDYNDYYAVHIVTGNLNVYTGRGGLKMFLEQGVIIDEFSINGVLLTEEQKQGIIKQLVTPHQTDAGIPQEESKDAVLGQTSDSMDAEIPKHNPEVSPIVAKIV